jgi:hypothetical protein
MSILKMRAGFRWRLKLPSRIKILLTRGIHNCGTLDFEAPSNHRCDAVSFGEHFPMIPTIIMPSPSGTA